MPARGSSSTRCCAAPPTPGKAVIVLSSDVVELQGLCDRVLVFSRGEIVRALEGEEITEENITGAAITSRHAAREGRAARARRRCACARFASGDYLPSVVLALLIVGLGALHVRTNGRFLTAVQLPSACCCSRARSCSSASAS